MRASCVSKFWGVKVRPLEIFEGAVMREDLASSSFLAVIIVSLIVVCSGLVALGI
jgi:hypothetical protein